MGIVENLVTKTKTSLKIILKHKNIVRRAFQLIDGRIISCSDDDYINIYSLYNTNHIDIQIKNNDLGVLDLIEIKKGIIIASCESLKLYKIEKKNYKIIQILNPHKELINRIIKLSNRLIVTCSDDQKIQFYKYKNNRIEIYNDINIGYKAYSIYECNKNEIVVYCGKIYENYLKFYDINNRQEIIRIKLKYYVVIPIYEIINKNYLVIGEYGKIIIFNLINHSIHQTIDLEYNYYIICCLKFNNNTLFCGDIKGNLY